MAFKLARKESRLGLSIFMTKWLSGSSATGKVMVQREKCVNLSCSTCDYPEEHSEHVLQYKSDNTCKLRDNTILKLRMWIKSVYTQPDKEFFICSELTSWLYNGITVFGLDTSVDPVIFTALRYRFLISYDSLLHRFIFRHIVVFQEDHYSEMSSLKLGTRCGDQLIRRPWKIIHLH